MRKALVVVASIPLLVLTTGCSHPGFISHSDESSLYEAVVQECLAPYFWGSDAEIVVFLSIGDDDPTSEIRNRFSVPRVRLRNGSDFEVGAGLHVSINSVEWIDSDTVRVQIVRYGGPLHGGGYTYRLSRRDEEWVLEEKTVEWIS